MASANDPDVSAVEEKIATLSVEASSSPEKKLPSASDRADVFEPHLSGFETRELYKLALNFYKGESYYPDVISLILLSCVHTYADTLTASAAAAAPWALIIYQLIESDRYIAAPESRCIVVYCVLSLDCAREVVIGFLFYQTLPEGSVWASHGNDWLCLDVRSFHE